MEPFDLDLNPAISGGIFYEHTYSNNSINILENNDFSNFKNYDLEESFSQNFGKVFSPISPDNKEDSFSEIDYDLNLNNVDDFIIIFQKKLNIYYFNKDFDGIINRIEKRFPFFFNEKNNGLLYLIQKLRFFELLREEKVNEAKKFYQDKLLILLKEVKKQNWEIKSKFFLKLIKKPNLILKQGDLQKKYYDQFTYELEKSIRTFLHEENEENQNKNDFLTYSNNNINIFSSSSIDLENLKVNSNHNSNLGKHGKNKKINDEEDEKQNNNEENDDELDMENRSTKEEFSDFEDELQQKCSDNVENKDCNIEQNNENKINLSPFLNTENENMLDIDIDPDTNNNNNLFMNLCMSSFSKSHKNSDDIFNHEDENLNENEFIIDTSSKNNQNLINEKVNYNENKINYINENPHQNKNNEEISTNEKSDKNKNNKSKKKNKKKAKNKGEETIFNQLPFLNSFKPKYIKRETIDKKIIRTFKNYVVKEYRQKRFEINPSTMDQNFFINFVNGNLLPPIDFYDASTGEYIKFNSFNCSYLLWFFSKKGVKDIYSNFINEKGKDFINNLSDYYEISQEEKNQLNSYIYNFPFIFDISLVNNITQGVAVSHIYRTVDKNKIQNRKKNNRQNIRNLDLKRNKSDSIKEAKERSRSREFE